MTQYRRPCRFFKPAPSHYVSGKEYQNIGRALRTCTHQHENSLHATTFARSLRLTVVALVDSRRSPMPMPTLSLSVALGVTTCTFVLEPAGCRFETVVPRAELVRRNQITFCKHIRYFALSFPLNKFSASLPKSIASLLSLSPSPTFPRPAGRGKNKLLVYSQLCRW